MPRMVIAIRPMGFGGVTSGSRPVAEPLLCELMNQVDGSKNLAESGPF